MMRWYAVRGRHCAVPMCDKPAEEFWDTVHRKPSNDAESPATLPVCSLHWWILARGGDLSLRYRG